MFCHNYVNINRLSTQVNVGNRESQGERGGVQRSYCGTSPQIKELMGNAVIVSELSLWIC